jgi:Fe-S-cluster containining protein
MFSPDYAIRESNRQIDCVKDRDEMERPEQDEPSEIAVALRLTVNGAEKNFEVRVPCGPRRLVDLLPAAREISKNLTGSQLEQLQAEGNRVSCRAGCGACCRQLVAISVVEAQALAELVTALPVEKQAIIRARFTDGVRRLEKAGVLDPADPIGDRALVARNLGSIEASAQDLGRRYFALQIPCPFLEDESCSIHAERPIVCREYHVTSPAERCARLFQAAIDRVPVRRPMSEALMRAAHRTANMPLERIPLALCLEWSEANGASLEQTADSMELLRAMMESL